MKTSSAVNNNIINKSSLEEFLVKKNGNNINIYNLKEKIINNWTVEYKTWQSCLWFIGADLYNFIEHKIYKNWKIFADNVDLCEFYWQDIFYTQVTSNNKDLTKTFYKNGKEILSYNLNSASERGIDGVLWQLSIKDWNIFTSRHSSDGKNKDIYKNWKIFIPNIWKYENNWTVGLLDNWNIYNSEPISRIVYVYSWIDWKKIEEFKNSYIEEWSIFSWWDWGKTIILDGITYISKALHSFSKNKSWDIVVLTVGNMKERNLTDEEYKIKKINYDNWYNEMKTFWWNIRTFDSIFHRIIEDVEYFIYKNWQKVYSTKSIIVSNSIQLDGNWNYYFLWYSRDTKKSWVYKNWKYYLDIDYSHLLNEKWNIKIKNEGWEEFKTPFMYIGFYVTNEWNILISVIKDILSENYNDKNYFLNLKLINWYDSLIESNNKIIDFDFILWQRMWDLEN